MTPVVLRVARAIFLVETAAVLVYAGFLVYADTTEAADNRRRAILVTVYFGLYALAFVAVAWALLRGRSWSLGPAIALQLLLAAISYYMIQGGATLLGVLVLSLAVTGVVLLLAPASRQRLGRR